jgi:hypothetical protein
MPVPLPNSSPEFANYDMTVYLTFFVSLILAFGLFWFIWQPRNLGIKKAEEFSYRITDNEADNCLKCECCDMKSLDGFEDSCKFFHIKIDENHVCDLLKKRMDDNW